MLMVALRLAYRQLIHRGAKLVAALLGVSVAIVLMFAQLGFQGALYDSAVITPRAFDADIILTNPVFQTMAFNPPWMPLHLLYEARGIEGVASASPFYAATVELTNPRDGSNFTSWLFAFSPDMPVFLQSDINRQLDLIRLPETAIIDLNSRNEIGLIAEKVREVGRDDLVMQESALSVQPVIKIRGVFRSGPTIDIDGNIVTSDLNYYRFFAAPLDRVSLGILRVAKGFDPRSVKQAIERRLGNKARTFLKEEFIRNEQSYYARETPIGIIFGTGLAVGVVVGIVFISQVLHGIVNDNLREFATLRAIGYKQNFFIVLVGMIALAISVISYLPSIVISVFVYRLAESATKLPLEMKITYMAEVFILVVTMGLIAASLSARKLKQADPVDLF